MSGTGKAIRVGTFVVDRPLRKRVPLPKGGFTTEPNGTERAEISIFVDGEKLARMLGPKAMRSKHKKSILQGGAVTIYAAFFQQFDSCGHPRSPNEQSSDRSV